MLLQLGRALPDDGVTRDLQRRLLRFGALNRRYSLTRSMIPENLAQLLQMTFSWQHRRRHLLKHLTFVGDCSV